MLDNQNTMIDKGWRQMQQVLNQEMPQEKKNKRWLWIILVALLGSVIFYWFLNVNLPVVNKQNENIQIAADVLPIPKEDGITELHGSQEKKTLYHQSKNKEKTIGKDDGDVSIKGFNIVQNKTYSKKNNETDKAKSPLEKSQLLLSVDTPITNEEQIDTRSSSSFTITNKHEGQLLIKSPKPIQIKGSKQNDVFLLNSLIINNLYSISDIQNPSFAKIESLTKKTQINGKWFISVSAKRLIDKRANLLGAEIGHSLPFSENISLYSSLQYHKLSTSKSFSTSGSNISNDLETTIAAMNNKVIQDETLNDFALNLGLRYSLKQKLIFIGGLKLSRNWGSFKSEETNSSIRTPASEDLSFSQWNYGFISGIEYLIHPKITLGVNYDYHIKNMIPILNANDTQFLSSEILSSSKQTMGIKMRYLF